MEQLRDIGYLDYTEFKRGRATYFSVHYRNPKLISGTVKVPRKEEEEKAPEQNYDEVIKALKAAGIDPQKLAEALSAMKPEN
ncbi:initiator replication protein RepB [Klebsiella pneumoniae]|jgi:flagellar basal body P-ring protein FlgI|nr:initiator replication protein RepB [Klebsiella oxytoca]STR74238.1 initiator replication protein RepB [Klebsiella pneumoniae]